MNTTLIQLLHSSVTDKYMYEKSLIVQWHLKRKLEHIVGWLLHAFFCGKGNVARLLLAIIKRQKEISKEIHLNHFQKWRLCFKNFETNIVYWSIYEVMTLKYIQFWVNISLQSLDPTDLKQSIRKISSPYIAEIAIWSSSDAILTNLYTPTGKHKNAITTLGSVCLYFTRNNLSLSLDKIVCTSNPLKL